MYRRKNLPSESGFQSSNSNLQYDPELVREIKEAVDPELLLTSLGFKLTKHSDRELRAPCRIHGGDNPSAFSFRTDSRRWRCYTQRCEQNKQGKQDNDVVSLVMAVLGYDFPRALEYLSSMTGISLEKSEKDYAVINKLRAERDIKNFIRTSNRIIERQENLPELSEELVQEFILLRNDYFIKEGFSPETLETFEIGSTYSLDKDKVLRATVPIRDHNGILVSVSGRRQDSDQDPRYKLTNDFKKGHVLYNLHRALTYSSDTVIIVEGFKACWAVHESGYGNVSACMGAELVEEQALLLVSCGISNVILMLDGDAAGRKGMLTSHARLSKYMKVLSVYLPDDTCPDDLARNDLKDLLDIYIQAI